MENNHYQHWQFSQDTDAIGWLVLDRKDVSVNTLNKPVLLELEQLLETLKKQQLRALVLRSAKKTGFIAGADIEQFRALNSSEEAMNLIRKAQEIFQILESLPIPTIAMIEGFCLGGGLELALACRYRIALDDEKTRLGLPEVKLGIHPGWGGTIRLPKLIGAFRAMDLILSGRLISAKAAKKMGVVDAAVPQRLLEKAVREFALQPPPCKRNYGHILSNAAWLRPVIGKILHKQLSQKISRKHYPAPFCVVENWVQHGVLSAQAMIEEARSIANLLVSPTAQNLVRVFFLQEALKNQAKGVALGFIPTHVHIIGAGVMGGDIAAFCAFRGLKVTLQDVSLELIGAALARAYTLAVKRLKEPTLVRAMMDRFIPDLEGKGIATADVIIEAITERLKAKQDLFLRLEQKALPGAILATNTSTIPLEKIAQVLKNPERLVGIHFFNPVEKMPLVEVVSSDNTNPEVIQKALAFVKRMDKLPLAVKSAPGFLVNRILLPYMLEAVTLLEEGIAGPVIDKAALGFGMPMGPIELADTVGLDICLAALESLGSHTKVRIPETLKELVAQKRLGRKTGQGFYSYQGKKVIKPKGSPHELAPPDIVERLMGRLLNEAMACLREGIVGSKDLLDAGCIFGFGFPPFLGGPMHYVTEAGEDRIKGQLEQLKSRYGDRFSLDKGWQL